MWGNNQLQAALSIAFVNNKPCTGMFNGSLFLWKDFKIEFIKKAHK